MNDLKEFWDDLIDQCELKGSGNVFELEDAIKKQGVFFWERGGKEWVIESYDGDENGNKNQISNDFDYAFNNAECLAISSDSSESWQQDFLDCVACLGEEKVKELIKELKGR